MGRMDDFRAGLGKQVRDLRKQRGMSQEALEKQASLERPWVSRLENRHHSLDDFDKLDRLAGGLGLTLGELLWPVLRPGDALEAELAARERFTQAQHDYQEGLRRQYAEALETQEARRLFNAIAQLGRAGRRYNVRDVRLIVAMIETATGQLLARQMDESPADLIQEVIAEQRARTE